MNAFIYSPVIASLKKIICKFCDKKIVVYGLRAVHYSGAQNVSARSRILFALSFCG